MLDKTTAAMYDELSFRNLLQNSNVKYITICTVKKIQNTINNLNTLTTIFNHFWPY